MSKDLYIPETPTFWVKVVFRLHFLSLLLFLSSRLPSCRIPSCWMDGIQAICLSTKKSSLMESLRGGAKHLVLWFGIPLVIHVIRLYPCLISTFCCVYNGCLISRGFRNSDKAQNSKWLKSVRITALKWRMDCILVRKRSISCLGKCL